MEQALTEKLEKLGAAVLFNKLLDAIMRDGVDLRVCSKAGPAVSELLSVQAKIELQLWAFKNAEKHDIPAIPLCIDQGCPHHGTFHACIEPPKKCSYPECQCSIAGPCGVQ